MSHCMFNYAALNLDRERDPIGWNKAWEGHLERTYQTRRSYLNFVVDSAYASILLDPSHYAHLQSEQNQLCTVQFDLANVMALKRETEQFETAWLAISPQKRERHLLKGLVVTCGSLPGMEDRRSWCPDTTLKFLEEGGGKGFLNLLATVCPQDVQKPELRSTPIFVAHPIFEAVHHIGEPCPLGHNKAARDLLQQQTVLGRNYFLSFFLWNTILAIYGVSQEYVPIKPATKADKGRTRRIRALDPASFDAFKTQAKEVVKSAERVCANCHTPASELPDDRRLLHCTKCMEIKQKVTYCSKECQRNDWKNGTPPHKRVCGKVFGMPDAIPSVPVTSAVVDEIHDRRFAPPDPGYVRSPALLEQLSLLHKHLHGDYVIRKPCADGDQHILVTIADPTEANIFRNFDLYAAITSGDPKAVGCMFRKLAEGAETLGIPKDVLLEQLSEEYDVDPETIVELSTDEALQRLSEECAAAQAERDRAAEEKGSV